MFIYTAWSDENENYNINNNNNHLFHKNSDSLKKDIDRVQNSSYFFKYTGCFRIVAACGNLKKMFIIII